jgi:hypothetical protein
MGWLVSTFGPNVGMAVSGLVPAVAAVVIGIHLARKHELRLSVTLRGPAPRVAIVRAPGVEAPAA